MSFMNDQRLYLWHLFEGSYSFIKRSWTCVEIVDIIELEKLLRVHRFLKSSHENESGYWDFITFCANEIFSIEIKKRSNDK